MHERTSEVGLDVGEQVGGDGVNVGEHGTLATWSCHGRPACAARLTGIIEHVQQPRAVVARDGDGDDTGAMSSEADG